MPGHTMSDELPETLDDLYAPRAIIVNIVDKKTAKRGRGFKPIRNHRDAGLLEADERFGDEILAENRAFHQVARKAVSKRK